MKTSTLGYNLKRRGRREGGGERLLREKKRLNFHAWMRAGGRKSTLRCFHRPKQLSNAPGKKEEGTELCTDLGREGGGGGRGGGEQIEVVLLLQAVT
jgi:hypothetical protein